MRRLWSGLIISFLFLPTLTAVLLGQVAALVLFGIVALLWFDGRRQPFLAGLALAPATVKPHVVYLVLALVLFALIGRKQWPTLAGFVAPLLAGTLVAFVLRPGSLREYGALMARNRIVYSITVPTPASVLAGTLDLPCLQYAGFLALPFSLIIWCRRCKDRPIEMSQLAVTAVIAW